MIHSSHQDKYGNIQKQLPKILSTQTTLVLKIEKYLNSPPSNILIYPRNNLYNKYFKYENEFGLFTFKRVYEGRKSELEWRQGMFKGPFVVRQGNNFFDGGFNFDSFTREYIQDYE